MLLLLLIVANICISQKFNFNEYNSTVINKRGDQPLCLNGTFEIKELEIRLEHYAYPCYIINPTGRHFEQWIVKDINDNLLAISNVRYFNQTFADDVFDGFEWEAKYESAEQRRSFHQIRFNKDWSPMKLISQKCCSDNSSTCLKSIEGLNQINPCITRKDRHPEYRVFKQKCDWSKDNRYEINDSSLMDNANKSSPQVVRRPFIKDTTLGSTSFKADTLSNMTGFRSIWYPSDPVYVERNQHKRCKTLKLNYFKSATEVKEIYLQLNQTYWTCTEGKATFTYRQRSKDPGTWILTDSARDDDKYRVYSMTLGDGFQNQFHFCQTDHEGAIDCSIPQSWEDGELSGEDRLVPLHHLRPQCVETDEIPLKTCSGQVLSENMPKFIYWGRVQFILSDINEYTSNKLCLEECNTNLTVEYTIYKSDEWELRSNASPWKTLAKSKSLFFDWRGICNDQTNCDSTFPMHSPSINRPKQCPELCVVHPLSEYEIELSRITTLNAPSSLRVYEAADVLDMSLIELTLEGKYQYKPNPTESHTLFTPLFDALCPNDVKYLMLDSKKFGMIKVNSARLCDNRQLPSDYMTMQGKNISPDRVVDTIDFNCKDKWPAGCRDLVVPMDPTESAPLMEMHLNVTTGKYTFVDLQNTFDFGVEHNNDKYYWVLRRKLRSETSRNGRIIALAYEPISCPSDAELFFVRKSEEIDGIETFSSSKIETLSKVQISCQKVPTTKTSFSKSFVTIVILTLLFIMLTVWLSIRRRKRMQHQYQYCRKLLEWNNFTKSDASQLMAEKFVHFYKIKSPLTVGSGHFGIVGRGNLTNKSLKMANKEVAFKKCHKCCEIEPGSNHKPNCLPHKLALEEIDIMNKLKGENVMSLLFISIDDRNHIVIGMEFMSNGSVEDYIKNPDNDVLTRDALKWVYQIGTGLIYLFDKGLIHRDVSARNALLDGDLNARLSDMGLTKSTGQEYNNDIYYAVTTQTPLPTYLMAPELLDSMIRKETLTFTHKSDVWAFGLLIWEILTRGEKAFSRYPFLSFKQPCIQATLFEIRNGCVPDFYRLGDRLELLCDDVVKRALTVDNEKRPDMRSLIKTISEYAFNTCEDDTLDFVMSDSCSVSSYPIPCDSDESLRSSCQVVNVNYQNELDSDLECSPFLDDKNETERKVKLSSTRNRLPSLKIPESRSRHMTVDSGYTDSPPLSPTMAKQKYVNIPTANQSLDI